MDWQRLVGPFLTCFMTKNRSVSAAGANCFVNIAGFFPGVGEDGKCGNDGIDALTPSL